MASHYGFTVATRPEEGGRFTAVVTSEATGTEHIETGFRWEGDAREYAESMAWNLAGRPGLDTTTEETP